MAAHFDRAEQAEFDHAQAHTVDSWVAKIATHAGLLVMSDVERAATLGRIREHLAATATERFALPMLTGVLRVRRR